MSPFSLSDRLSQLMAYLAQQTSQGNNSLPSLSELRDELGISVSTLREELQVARAMGLVEVRPRTGIKCLPYSFSPTVSKSLAYAVCVDKNLFREFSDLRNHTEASYWYQAVSSLTPEDIDELRQIISSAQKKLNSETIQLPHEEHRKLHLTIYRRLNNTFVQGILEAYWDIYEGVGLNVYEDRKYLERVWNYHQQMVDSIASANFLSGYQALIAHMDLLFQREQNSQKLPFE
jgi:DNA-binding FadR family transcriptional regulator